MKDAESSGSDVLGHSTQSILNLCELMGENMKAVPEPSFTLNPSNQPSPI
jgi:hypothetical protein